MQTGSNTILITGGTSGIGQAFVEAFLKEGDKVITCGRREDRLAGLRAAHPGLVTRVCDVALASDRDALYQWVVKEHPDVNVLINNAGVQLMADLKNPLDLSRVYAEVDTNLVAPIHLSTLFSAHLSTKDEAAIVNISSGLAFCPIAAMPIYCATKAAIHSFTLSLRHQLKGTSVKVFEIAPPAVDTELGHDRRADKTKTHGGMPVAEFITGAMEAFKTDNLEAPIGTAARSRAMREEFFEQMNQLFEERWKG